MPIDEAGSDHLDDLVRRLAGRRRNRSHCDVVVGVERFANRTDETDVDALQGAIDAAPGAIGGRDVVKGDELGYELGSFFGDRHLRRLGCRQLLAEALCLLLGFPALNDSLA